MRSPRIRAPKLLAAAEGQPCIRCGRQDGTVVAAHYSGVGSHRLGKGMGCKGHDLFHADFCAACHAEMDGYQDGNGDGRAMEFLLLCAETLVRRYREGLLKI